MNSNNAIEVKNLKKSFKVYYDKGHMLKERLIFANRNRHEERWVLNGISFDVKKGEAIGLIGKNGCGKSTTLKLLNRIIYPNSGSVEINGKVSSLIELGAGFHEDMTGRENIYINASIFGLTHKEIDERLDDIIRFSELEEFIDNPVRTYSSGMYMRLAFSVAINVDAEVLLIDEILAVGDVNFQEKCFQKLRDIKRSGTTIVIVSHSLGQIEKICDRAIWIDKGLVKEDGAPRAICKHYLESMEYDRLERAEQEYVMQKEAEARRIEEEKRRKEEEENKKREEIKRRRLEKQEEDRRRKQEAIERRQREREITEEENRRKEEERLRREEDERRKKLEEEKRKKNLTCRDICKQCGPDAHREGNWKARYTSIVLCDGDGIETTEFSYGEKFVVSLQYECFEKDLLGNFIIGITRDDWVYCYGSTSQLVLGEYTTLDKNGCVRFEIDSNRFGPGKYYLDVRIKDKDDEVLDNVFSVIMFKVEVPKKYGWGTLSMDNRWTIGRTK